MIKIILIIFIINLYNSYGNEEPIILKREDLKKIKYIERKKEYKEKREYIIEENKKEEIVKIINEITEEEFEKIYKNVINYKKEKKMLTTQLEKENIKKIIKDNYKNMLESIAYTESGFKHKVGLIDEDDISYFQINIKENIWNTRKIEKMVNKENITRNRLINDIELSSRVALHILIYNISLFINKYEIKNIEKKDIGILVATYNHPFKLKEYYVNKVEKYLNI